MNTIVLAYSGGLDTSIAIPWLAERYRAEVVTVTVDLGQGSDLDDVRERALAIGAARAHVIDARQEFAREFLVPALQAGASGDGGDPLATALGRPLIARHLVALARIEGATTVAHGSAGDGPDHARLESSIRALDPALRILAPVRERRMTRPDAIEYARARGIPVAPPSAEAYRIDVNLWGRSIDGAALQDSWQEPPASIYALTPPAAEAPDRPASVEIEFTKGVPVAINGVALPLVELISSLETIAGAHGIGRLDLLVREGSGAASRRIREAPAATVLHAAHRDLQASVTPRDLDRLASTLGAAYAELIEKGQWQSPARAAIDAFVARVQEPVTGVVRLTFFKGQCHVIGRKPAEGDAVQDTRRAATPVAAGRKR